MAELGREYTNLFWFISRRDEDREEGGRWIGRALALEPENPSIRLAHAEFLYRAHLDYDAALEELDRAAQGLPGSAETVELRGYILRRAGRAREMAEAIRSAILLAPRYFPLLQVAVENAWLVGDIEDAQSWYRRLEALPDVPPIALSNYPEARMRVLGDAEALSAFLQRQFGAAVDARTGSAAAGFNALYLAGKFPTLAQKLDEVSAEIVEDQFELLPIELLRARVAWAQDDLARVELHARAALALVDEFLAQYPADYRALTSRAESLALLGETEAAREALDQAFAQHVPSRDVIIRSELLARKLLVHALIDPPEHVATAMDEYLQLEMKYWYFDGLMLHPVLKRHRDHPAFQALAAKYSRKGSGS
jgi:Tfp pilus assembly protein PilF